MITTIGHLDYLGQSLWLHHPVAALALTIVLAVYATFSVTVLIIREH
jgi:hypothetical protein